MNHDMADTKHEHRPHSAGVTLPSSLLFFIWLPGAGVIAAATSPRPFEMSSALIFFILLAICSTIALWVFRSRLGQARIGTFIIMLVVVAAFLAFFSHHADQEPYGSAFVDGLVYSWPWAVMGARDHAPSTPLGGPRGESAV
jgi:drug/metabolite transporter (DMT)-like permease